MQLVGAALWGCCVCISPSLQITAGAAWERPGTDRLRPSSQETTGIVSEAAAAANCQTGDLFCVFHLLFFFVCFLNKKWLSSCGWRKWISQFSVLQKHVCRNNICIPQLKQADRWTQRLCPGLLGSSRINRRQKKSKLTTWVRLMERCHRCWWSPRDLLMCSLHFTTNTWFSIEDQCLLQIFKGHSTFSAQMRINITSTWNFACSSGSYGSSGYSYSSSSAECAVRQIILRINVIWCTSTWWFEKALLLL